MLHIVAVSRGPCGSIEEPSVLFGVRLRTPPSDVSSLDYFLDYI